MRHWYSRFSGGWFSDRVGRLNAIAIGSIAGVLGWIVYILAPSWQWLLISSITGAITASFIAPSFQAFIAEQSSEESRGRVYGITEAMFMIVGVVGPPLGGYLSQYLGFKQMFMVGAALYVIATAIRVVMARKATKSAVSKVQPPSFSGLAADLRAMIALVLGGGVLTWIMISDEDWHCHRVWMHSCGHMGVYHEPGLLGTSRHFGSHRCRVCLHRASLQLPDIQGSAHTPQGGQPLACLPRAWESYLSHHHS